MVIKFLATCPGLPSDAQITITTTSHPRAWRPSLVRRKKKRWGRPTGGRPGLAMPRSERGSISSKQASRVLAPSRRLTGAIGFHSNRSRDLGVSGGKVGPQGRKVCSAPHLALQCSPSGLAEPSTSFWRVSRYLAQVERAWNDSLHAGYFCLTRKQLLSLGRRSHFPLEVWEETNGT